MIRLPIAAMLIAMLAGALPSTAGSPQFTRQPTPAALKAAVTDAELWGRRLLDVLRSPPPNTPLLETAAQTAHAALKTGCPGRYIFLSPDDRTDDGILLYELAELRPGVINIGGQSKLLISPDGRTALTITRSARTCLTLEEPGSATDTTGAWVTHVLSPTPTEFHVLANLHAKLPLFVATSAGAWIVDNGTIHYMGPLDPPQPQ
jgi:hypothetical protein